MTPSATEQLAAYYAELKQEQISHEVLEKAKQCVLDYLGCTIGAVRLNTSQMVRDAFMADACPGKSTIFLGETAPADKAAFINAAYSHGLEMDDMCTESGAHNAVSIMPAVIAVAEEREASGWEVLRAVLVGYDIASRIGASATPDSMFRRGFHPTSLVGAFSATAAVATVMGLSPARLASALGIVGSFTSGNLECYADGSQTKRINPAGAAQAAVQACRLAERGYIGPKWILEGARGFLTAYTDEPHPENLLRNLDHRYDAVLRTEFKPYSSCRYNHTSFDACLDIAREPGFDWRRIKSVKAEITSMAFRGVGEPRDIKYDPDTVVAAQFSLPYNIALGLVKQKAAAEQFTMEVIYDPEVRGLMPKITLEPTEEMDTMNPITFPARVTVQMEDGTVYASLHEFAKGAPEAPLSRAELEAKFISLVRMTMSDEAKITAVMRSCEDLEHLAAISEITKLLRQAPATDVV